MSKPTGRRNLILFTIVTLSAGWIGAWLNTVLPIPAINPQLTFGGFISLQPQTARVFSPGNEGLVVMLLTLLVGAWMPRKKPAV